jgi:hypothetical protein
MSHNLISVAPPLANARACLPGVPSSRACFKFAIISASAENRGNSCQRKHPAEMLALGPPSCTSHRRSSNANSLRNSAGSPEICATFQVPQCHGARWRRTISRHNDSAGSLRLEIRRDGTATAATPAELKTAGAGCCTAGAN